eukprot:g66749.t1
MFRKTINDCVTTLQTRLVAQYCRQLTHITGRPASYVWPRNQELLAYTQLYALEQDKCRLWRPDFWWVLEAHCCPVAARLWRSCLEHWLRRASAPTSGPVFAALSKVLRLALQAYDVGAVPARGCGQRSQPHFHAGDGSCRDATCASELGRWAHAEESWLLAQGRRTNVSLGPPAGGARPALELALDGKVLGANWRRLLLPVAAWVPAAERAAGATARNLEVTWMYSPASIKLDPPANPTLFGFQYYMRQDKTSEVQFKRTRLLKTLKKRRKLMNQAINGFIPALAPDNVATVQRPPMPRRKKFPASMILVPDCNWTCSNCEAENVLSDNKCQACKKIGASLLDLPDKIHGAKAIKKWYQTLQGNPDPQLVSCVVPASGQQGTRSSNRRDTRSNSSTAETGGTQGSPAPIFLP